jgi:hypothetical protein
MEEPIILGNENNSWRWTEEGGFDLTHTDSSTPIPRLKLQVHGGAVTIAPIKTALVIIYMQNYLLALKKHHPGHAVEKTLVHRAIPAARRAGIQVIWLNWGLSDADLENMQPNLQRIFSFREDGTYKKGGGIGHNMGNVPTEEDGSGTVPGGRFLIQDEWNTRLHGPLKPYDRKASKGSDQTYSSIRIGSQGCAAGGGAFMVFSATSAQPTPRTCCTEYRCFTAPETALPVM